MVDVLHAMTPNMSTSRHRSRRAFWLRVHIKRRVGECDEPHRTGVNWKAVPGAPFFFPVMRIRFPKENVYSEKYQDDRYEYRHVIMNEATAHKVWILTDFMSRLMPEKEWRAAGVNQQTRGWIHYDAWSC
jgi:hypothetical protein